MHVSRGLLGWGLFFIVAGAVPLAVRGGVLDEALAARAWQLWPVLLIGAGLGLVLSRTRAAIAGGLVVAMTAGLMAGGLVASGFDRFPGGITGCAFSPSSATAFPDQRGTLGAGATVRLALDCGELAVLAADGDGWAVTGLTRDGELPRIDASAGRLDVRPPGRGGVVVGSGDEVGARMDVRLPRGSTITSLDLAVNAGSAEVDLRGMALGAVRASANAGSVRMDLSGATALDVVALDVNAGSGVVALPARSLSGDLSANAGSLRVCVPTGAGVRVALRDNSLGSNNLGAFGLERNGDTWATPGYASAGVRIDLTASANLGSLELAQEGTCDG